ERRDREWPGSGRRSFAGARARVVSERRAAWGIALAAAAVAALVAVLALFTGRTPRRESRPAVDAGPSSLSDAGTPAPGGEAAVGSKAPLFGAWTISKTPRVLTLMHLRREAGRLPIVLVFVASWCTPCRAMVERIQHLDDSGRAFRLVLVAVEPQTPPADSWLAALASKHTDIHDKFQVIAPRYLAKPDAGRGGVSLPAAFVLDGA